MRGLPYFFTQAVKEAMKLDDKIHLEYIVHKVGPHGMCDADGICDKCLVVKPCTSTSLGRKKERFNLAKLLLSQISIEAVEGEY